MNIDILEQRIIELEMRLSYQDHTIEQLNDVVTAHQRQIDCLLTTMQGLREKLANDAHILSPNEDIPPPHY